MFAKLTALVSGGTALPYELAEGGGSRIVGGWTHHSAVSKSDKSPVSVFKYTCAPGQDARKAEAAKHGVKSLRTLRHPNILIFKDSIEIEEKSSATALYLVTEPVQLLTDVLEDDQLTEDQRNAYVAMGLRQVTCALNFLNNDCHQACNKSPVIIGLGCWQNLDWKLCYLDMLSEHASLSTSVLRDCSAFLSDVYKCPELAKQDWEGLTAGPPWAIDSWGLGCLIREVFGGGVLDSTTSLRETDCIPEDLLKDYQRLLNSHGQKRLNPQRLLKNKYLHNQLVEVVNFLESLAVKETSEKNTFFKRLSGSLDELPAMVIHQKILPIVVDALEFGSASPNALGCIMKIADGMEEEQFQKSIVPAITRFFNSTDRTIRRVLLENIDKFGDRLPAALVDETIYPALSNGFSDSNAYLRELTLKSMQQFASKLSQKTLNQSLLKFLARLQVDPEPSIRANTTVLLGFIADHLGEASCKRILLNAFTRALKDQFTPARLAGLKALMATKKYYSPGEVAHKLIPSVSPLCIDGVEEVKKQALGCMDTFVNVLRDAAAADIGTLEETQPSDSKPSTSQTYLSWAVSSLGFSHGTDSGNKSEAKAEPKVSSQTSSPLKREEEPPPEVHQHHPPTTRVSSPDDSEGEWDFDDEPFEDEEPPKPNVPARAAVRPPQRSDAESGRVTKKSTTEEHDVWDDLGMKASMPTETTVSQRRKPKGTTKPMKLGAKKL